jgi:hypothetical protein
MTNQPTPAQQLGWEVSDQDEINKQAQYLKMVNIPRISSLSLNDQGELVKLIETYRNKYKDFEANYNEVGGPQKTPAQYETDRKALIAQREYMKSRFTRISWDRIFRKPIEGYGYDDEQQWMGGSDETVTPQQQAEAIDKLRLNLPFLAQQLREKSIMPQVLKAGLGPQLLQLVQKSMMAAQPQMSPNIQDLIKHIQSPREPRTYYDRTNEKDPSPQMKV